MQVDINCDMGEGYGRWSLGDDAAMLDIVTSANVACGYHAGDPNIMVETARLAKERGVSVGAHPGFNDLWGFGRRVIRGDSMAEIERMVAYQIGAMQGVDSSLVYVTMPGLPTERAAEEYGLAQAAEIFADRAYEDDGQLMSRKKPGSVLHDADDAAGRVLQMVRDGALLCASGKRIPARIETICVHGDGPTAVAMARRVREVLEADGVRIRPFKTA
jgi:UPF0271 protein